MSVRRSFLLLVLGVATVGGTALARRATEDQIDYSGGTSLNPAQTAQQAGDYMNKMRNVQSRITKLQDQARDKKDILKLNCVSDKLVQVRAHISVADQSFAQLNAAIARSDDGARKHELTRMTIIYQKVTVLGT